MLRCRDAFGGAGVLDEFWQQIHGKLAYLHGSPVLYPRKGGHRYTPVEDAVGFLGVCSDEHFLDFVELVFRVDSTFSVSGRESLVEDFNDFLRADDLPYSITSFVWTKGTTVQYGREYESTTLTEYPQVVMKDSEFLHASATAPTLQLIADARFAAVNAEILAALKDYRHSDYGDCLTKCGSAFESVLKVICRLRRWPYRDSDTPATLIKTVIAKAGLDPFLEQPLIVIATLRNKLSTAHGAGPTPRLVSPAKAEYALNATASAILFLIKETV
jgi:hypothetical protein